MEILSRTDFLNLVRFCYTCANGRRSVCLAMCFKRSENVNGCGGRCVKKSHLLNDAKTGPGRFAIRDNNALLCPKLYRSVEPRDTAGQKLWILSLNRWPDSGKRFNIIWFIGPATSCQQRAGGFYAREGVDSAPRDMFCLIWLISSGIVICPGRPLLWNPLECVPT